MALPSAARPIAVGRQSDDETSLDRLDAECGEQLRELGFFKNDVNDRWGRPVWTEHRWRPTGYTQEQRRLIKGRNKPATLPQKEVAVL